jgi:hypothetical protein
MLVPDNKKSTRIVVYNIPNGPTPPKPKEANTLARPKTLVLYAAYYSHLFIEQV